MQFFLSKLVNLIKQTIKSQKMKVAGVLIDLSGTIHVEDVAITNAVEAINRLKQSGIPYRFATNTTKESRAALTSKLNSLGFNVDEQEVFTSLNAAVEIAKKQNLKPHLMLEKNALLDFESLACGTQVSPQDCDSIIVGLAPSHFCYERMNKVFQALQQGDKKLIAIHKGRYFKAKDGLAIGPGAFVTALEYSSGVSAEVVGKPTQNFFHQAILQLGNNINPKEVFMIGDDVRDDVEGAIKCDLKGILVKTGKYQKGDENKINPSPNFTFDSIVEAIDYLIAYNAE